MGAFWTDAENLFETARQGSLAGSPDCDLAIVIGAGGEIRMLDAAGWALPSLAAEHGARTVYRVTRERGSVRLEGRSGAHACMLSSRSPAGQARELLRAPLPPAVAPAVPLLAAPQSAPPRKAALWTTFA